MVKRAKTQSSGKASEHLITALRVFTVSYPSSREMNGSDAFHHAPDYTAVVVQVHTSQGLVGCSLVFMCGDGADLVAQAVRKLERFVIGRSLKDFIEDPGSLSLALKEHHQLRWSREGIYHMAVGGLVNAMWDLWAKFKGVPLWQLLVDLTIQRPRILLDAIDFGYIEDVLTRVEAEKILQAGASRATGRIEKLQVKGPKMYLTIGWSGLDLDVIRQGCQDLLDKGCEDFKSKVAMGIDADAGKEAALVSDRERLSAMREVVGERRIFVDANQVFRNWRAAADYMKQLREFNLWAIEEPIAPHDVLGYRELAVALEPCGINVVGGEHAQDIVVWKQLISTGAIVACQVDATRMAGLPEILAVILMAKKYGIPVWPHAGGIGLCNMVAHLAVWDHACVAGIEEQRVEFVHFLHGEEVFCNPVSIEDGCYVLPESDGWGVELQPGFISKYGEGGSDRASPIAADLKAVEVAPNKRTDIWLRPAQ